MSTQLKLRRGTTTEHSTFTGAEGEVTVDMTKDTLVVHDGVTAGGHPVAREAYAVAKDSSTGAAYIPSGTTAQRPVTPANGYLRYNSDLLSMEAYVNGAWGSVGGGATGGGTDNVFIENEYTITTDYTIPAGRSAVSVGDSAGNITINNGVTVTFGDNNSRWVVL